MSNPKVFSRTGIYTFGLRRGQSVTVNFPSDEQLAERDKQIKTYFTKDSALADEEGREEADEKLIISCKTEDSPIPNQDGCVEAVTKLLANRLQKPSLTPTGYTVTLTVPWPGATYKTVHNLKEPSKKEQSLYRKRAIFIGESRFDRQESRTFLPEVVRFYDKLFESVEGYDANDANAVPGNHKLAVINAMIAQIRDEEQADKDAPDPN